MPSYNKKGFMQDIQDGRVSGWSLIDKFGFNANLKVQHSDIWSIGGLYAWPASALSMSIASTSTADASAGSGAATVEIQGLDTDWREVSETIALNGTTGVPLVNTYRRIHRAAVKTAGSAAGADAWNVGALNITNGGLTYLQVPATENQSQHGMYTIPSGKTGYLVDYHLTAGKADEVFVCLQVRDNSNSELFNTIRSHHVTENPLKGSFDQWYKLNQFSDIRFRNYRTAAANRMFVNFLILLKDNNVQADGTG